MRVRCPTHALVDRGMANGQSLLDAMPELSSENFNLDNLDMNARESASSVCSVNYGFTSVTFSDGHVRMAERVRFMFVGWGVSCT